MKEFTQFLFSWLFLKNLLIALGIFLVLIFFLIKCLDIFTRHGQEVEVPLVLNSQVGEATRNLENKLFHVKIDSVFVNDKPGGLVIDQNPAGGQKVKENRTIYLTIVTYTAPSVHIPRFEDTPFKEYESILKGLGLYADSITYKHDIALDLVLGVIWKGKKLAEGASVPKGSKLGIILGDGNGSELTLPNLVGLNLDDAKFAIRGAQLLLGRVRYDSTTHDTLRARVYKQNPPFPSDSVVKISQGTFIDLYLKD